MGKPLIERLRDRCEVDEETGCWLWLQGMGGDGTSPVMGFAELSPNPVNVRRLMYVVAVGPIPPKRVISPSCGDLRCICPQHLKVREKNQSLRGRVQPADYGIKRLTARVSGGSTKLDWQKADEIRARRAAGETNVALAREYGVTDEMISKIVNGHAWKRGPFLSLSA